MYWLVAIGCLVIAGIVIFCIKKANQRKLIQRIEWQDVNVSRPTLPSNRPTSTPDQSSIVWQDLPQELPSSNTEEFTISELELEESWELDDFVIDSTNGHSTNNNTTFLDPDHNPTIQELLKSVIGTRDLLTQEEFQPRQRVYFCSNCTLAHHEDSWRDSGNRCSQCESNEHTQLYTLPDND